MTSNETKMSLNLIIPSLLRFLMELTAWGWLLIAGFTLNLLYIGLFILSLSIMALMNFPGDKAGGDGPISVPGYVRIFNELVFAGLFSIFSAYLLFGINGFIIQTGLVILVIIFDHPRYLWMLGFKTSPPEYVSYLFRHKKSS